MHVHTCKEFTDWLLGRLAGKRLQKQFGILQEAAVRVRDKALQKVLPSGVAFHHAALEASDRAIVERLFVNSELSVHAISLVSSKTAIPMTRLL